MKSVVVKQAKGRVEIEERERPKPGPDEVLIRVQACGVCHGDLMVRDGHFHISGRAVVVMS
jgi:D-arabinose 1-dehydrogenase-like Zn-dependent alcohol dehydrogenase